MGYIIVWRNSLQDPFIHISDNYFKEEFNSYDDAKKEAESAKDNQLFSDYAIYQEIKSRNG